MRTTVCLLCLLGSQALAFAVSPVGKHSPMHPTNTQFVTFKGIASGGVDKVRLSYRRATLSTSADGSHVQKPAENDTELVVCDPQGTQPSIPCPFTMKKAFPAESLVTFTVKAWDGNGNVEEEEYSFATGDYPWPTDPIPIRVKNVTARALDVVFIPDKDITVANLRARLHEVVDLYFLYPEITESRRFHNFYYSSIQGDYEERCNFTNPSNMAKLMLVADTVAFLHVTELRDCKVGNRFSSEISYGKSLIHESGHSFYGLEDEYCCGSSYAQQPCTPNLYASLAACETDAPLLGYPTSNCAQLTKGNQKVQFWRIDPNGAGGCLMGEAQHTPGSAFQKACARRIRWRYGKCAGGDCMPANPCP